MTAVTYCLRKAGQMGMPVAMNISIGNHYGSHAGDSLLETYIDEVCNQWRCNVIIGTGNEGGFRHSHLREFSCQSAGGAGGRRL